MATKAGIFNLPLNRESGLIFPRQYCADVFYGITEGTLKSYLTLKELHTDIIERSGRTDILSIFNVIHYDFSSQESWQFPHPFLAQKHESIILSGIFTQFMFDVFIFRVWEGAFLGPILTARCAPTNPSPRAIGLGPSHPPHAVFSYHSKMLLRGTFRKKRLLSIKQALCLHVQPVTKPWPPRSHADYSGPGRNNQRTRGKGPLGFLWINISAHVHATSTAYGCTSPSTLYMATVLGL